MADSPIPSPVTYLPSARRPLTEAHRWHPVVAKGASGRSSTWDPCPQVPQGHPRVAKHHLTDLRMVPFRCTSRSSARRVGPQVLQGHPGVAKGYFWPVFGTATLPTGTSGASSRGKVGFWTVFGTATPPTGAPEASRRGEGGPLSAL